MGIIYKLMKHRNLNVNLPKSPKNGKIKKDRNRLITIEGNIIEAPPSASTNPNEEDSGKEFDSNMDKQFTAEHIIQLCKFLAEKSKRNKNLHKQQQSPKKFSKSEQTQFPFRPTNCDDDEVDFYQDAALPLVSKQKLELQQIHNNESENDFEEPTPSAVLSTRLSSDINSLNISSNTITETSCALQHYQQQQHLYQKHQQQQPQHTHSYHLSHHHQQQLPTQLTQTQGKRDILLKIRRQIFERQRLRENGIFEPQAFNNSQVWRPW